jgi:hypothetical protein
LARGMGFMRTLPSGVPDSSFGTNGITYVANTSKADGYFLPLTNGKFLMVSAYYYPKNGVTRAGMKLQQFKSYSNLIMRLIQASVLMALLLMNLALMLCL